MSRDKKEKFFSPRNSNRAGPKDADSIFSVSSSKASQFHAANPNPQSGQIRFNRPNMAEFQDKIKLSNPTGLPGLMSPRYPDDKFQKRVVFPTDKATRRDI